MEITGKITKGADGVYNAKVFITDSKMALFDKNFAVRSDADGKFKLKVPTIIENGKEIIDFKDRYVAFESLSPSGKGIKALEKDKTEYNFDTENFVKETTDLPEFTVTATKKVDPVIPPKKKNYWWIIPVALAVVGVGTLIYLKTKKK